MALLLYYLRIFSNLQFNTGHLIFTCNSDLLLSLTKYVLQCIYIKWNWCIFILYWSSYVSSKACNLITRSNNQSFQKMAFSIQITSKQIICFLCFHSSSPSFITVLIRYLCVVTKMVNDNRQQLAKLNSSSCLGVHDFNHFF